MEVIYVYTTVTLVANVGISLSMELHARNHYSY
jgi:hypothetical protein